MLKLFSKLLKNQVESIIKKRKKFTMSETESSKIMIQKFNPSTGEFGWAVQDEDYDFHQEIARSAFADMLHDSERNDKYYEAIKKAIEQKHREGQKAHVLDIGTGTGLLAMMAARCGADTIHACEAFAPISKCAEEVIKENGLTDRITVIHKRSTAVTVGDELDIPQRCNILVTEVFDTELIGEGAITTFNHALRNLLSQDCLVVPSRGTVYAQVVESDWMQRWNRLAPWGALEPSQAILRCPGAAAVHDLQLSQLREKWKPITEPQPVFRFDWTGRSGQIPEEDRTIVTTNAVNSGLAQMVFMWWSLDMDQEGEVVLSCAPWWAHPSLPPGPEAIPWRDHWMQAVYYLPTPLPVQDGQALNLISSHDEFSLWFNLTICDKSLEKDSLAKYLPQVFSAKPSEVAAARPVCDCMLHAMCSRTRIGMLNDPSRRDKYLQVLRRLITPESVVLSLGDTSLLGLMAAKLGASKVYHMEDNSQSREVMEELIKDNDLKSKVTLIKPSFHSRLDDKIRLSVNLVIAEPYFMTALCPWHVTRWWDIKRQCPNAAGMPAAVSLHIMPMQFDHLHKIRAPLGTISGFKMTAFDQLVQNSSAISDSSVEVHPLWEYPGICLGPPKETERIDEISQDHFSEGYLPFNVSGMWHGVAMWVDIHLDADTTVSTGPVEPPVPGKPVHWDPYTRQAVHFILPEVPVSADDFLQYKVTRPNRQIHPKEPKESILEHEVQFQFFLQKPLNF